MSIDYDNSRDSADAIEDLYLTNRMVGFQNSLELLFTKCLEIFEYNNLPATLPKRVLEKYITRNGFAVVYQVDGETFVSDQTPDGDPDIYGEDRKVTIQHFSDRLERTIGVDAVMFRNDSNRLGLETLLSEFALLTAQAKITMLNGLVMARTNYILQAKDETAAKSALEFESQVRSGRTSVLLAEEFTQFEGMNLHNTPVQGTQLTQGIALINFIQAYYYSELGITLNNNMKSQYQSEDELQKSTGIPLIYNMLAERMESVRDANALFDLDIEVSLSNEWEKEIDPDEELDEGNPVDGDEETTETEEEGEPETGSTPEETEEESDAPADQDAEEEIIGDEPDEITRDELIEATETLMDEEVPHADEPETPGEDEDNPDSDQDEA